MAAAIVGVALLPDPAPLLAQADRNAAHITIGTTRLNMDRSQYV
jgi:hypothetical protein